MSQWDKLLKRIKGLSKDLRFKELAKVLNHYGYRMEQPKGGSSHYIFRKKGYDSITIPKHGNTKIPYVKRVKEIIECEDKKHEKN